MDLFCMALQWRRVIWDSNATCIGKRLIHNDYRTHISSHTQRHKPVRVRLINIRKTFTLKLCTRSHYVKKRTKTQGFLIGILKVDPTCNLCWQAWVSTSSIDMTFSAAAARYFPWRGWNLIWVLPPCTKRINMWRELIFLSTYKFFLLISTLFIT